MRREGDWRLPFAFTPLFLMLTCYNWPCVSRTITSRRDNLYKGDTGVLDTPTKYTIVGAACEGNTKLTAFDKCLLASGIGNLNLLRVSSILPPNTKPVEKLEIPPGSLTPTAYGYIYSDVPGEQLAAAVAIGINTEDTYGVIMEYEGNCTAAEAEKIIRGMVEEAFQVRGIPLNQCLVKAVEHKVEKCGCAFAAVALWY